MLDYACMLCKWSEIATLESSSAFGETGTGTPKVSCPDDVHISVRTFGEQLGNFDESVDSHSYISLAAQISRGSQSTPREHSTTHTFSY